MFINRPNNHIDARFYAINFLNVLNPKHMDSNTSAYLSNFYFKLFFSTIKEPENVKTTKILSLLLSGINKVFPYCKNLVSINQKN